MRPPRGTHVARPLPDGAGPAGVSPSAISQAERGRRGLSLDTLLDLSARLNVTLDELLRGDVAPGYRIARRDGPPGRAEGTPIPLLTTRARGSAPTCSGWARASPRRPGSPTRASSSSRWRAASCRCYSRPASPCCERRALVAESSGVAGWRNLGDREALVLWVLRD